MVTTYGYLMVSSLAGLRRLDAQLNRTLVQLSDAESAGNADTARVRANRLRVQATDVVLDISSEIRRSSFDLRA